MSDLRSDIFVSLDLPNNHYRILHICDRDRNVMVLLECDCDFF
jgi:hypothetical protein